MVAFPGSDTVMMKIPDVETLLRHRGEVRSSYFPADYTVITSGMINDEDLMKLRWTRERNAVQAFQPEFHIATDYPIYGNMEKVDRMENIEKMTSGTEWMHRQLSGTSTQVLPLVKGFTPEERAICLETLRSLDIPYCAYYCAQYFGGEMGNGINKLNQDVRDVVSELNLDGMLLVGLQSQNGLAKMPPEVTAAAGQRWITKSGLRDVPMSIAAQRYLDWKNGVEEELGGGIATLGSFMDSSGVMVHG